jgi:hypothetical protein
MKISTLPTLSTLSLLALAALTPACSTSEGDGIPSHPVDQTPAEVPPAPAPKRTLVTGDQLPTSPVNLLIDPGFGLVGEQAGFGAFLAFLDETFEPVDLTTRFDSRSPARFGGSVGVIMAAGATDKKSDAVIVITTFPGGAGPYHASVWVSKSTISGKPTAFTPDAKSIQASVTDGTLDGTAYDLAPAPEAPRVAGDRTWIELRAEVDAPLVYGGYFVLRTGEGGGKWLVAAPEVVAQPLVDALGTRSRAARAAVGRPRTPSESKAVAKYRSIEPVLIPAIPKTRRAK